MTPLCSLCGGSHYPDLCPYKEVLDTSDRVVHIDKLCLAFSAMKLDIQLRNDRRRGEANRIAKGKVLTAMGRSELLREIEHLRSYFTSSD